MNTMDISFPTTYNHTCSLDLKRLYLEGAIACALATTPYNTTGETEYSSIADNQLKNNASILPQAVN